MAPRSNVENLSYNASTSLNCTAGNDSEREPLVSSVGGVSHVKPCSTTPRTIDNTDRSGSLDWFNCSRNSSTTEFTDVSGKCPVNCLIAERRRDVDADEIWSLRPRAAILRNTHFWPNRHWLPTICRPRRNAPSSRQASLFRRSEWFCAWKATNRLISNHSRRYNKPARPHAVTSLWFVYLVTWLESPPVWLLQAARVLWARWQHPAVTLKNRRSLLPWRRRRIQFSRPETDEIAILT
jgi:hypothetical protein